MRSRSLLTFLFFCFTALGLAGCGSSNNNAYGGEYVNTNPAAPINVGGLTFNFAPQLLTQTVDNSGAFDVPAETDELRFAFYENAGAIGEPALTTTAAFNETVTITGLSTSLQSVRVTALDDANIPLVTFTQSVTVVGGEITTVRAIADGVPVTLVDLRLVSSVITFEELTSVDLEVNGTYQAYLAGLYSDGTIVVLADAATYSNDPNDADGAAIVEVGSLGQLRGLSPGQTNLIVQFQGQTITVPVTVVDVLSVTFSAILIGNDPITVSAGANQAIAIFGQRSNDGAVFGISPTSANLTLSVAGDAGISVVNGAIQVAANTPGGSEATLTATYLNSNGTTVSDTSTIVVSGVAGVANVAVSVNRTNLFSGVPVYTSQVAIQETLTDGTTRAGSPADYNFSTDTAGVVTVSADGVATATGAGVVTVTATLATNSAVSGSATITVESASVASVAIEPPTPAIPAGGSQAFTLTATLNNGAASQITVTSLSAFALSGPGAGSFSVLNNIVSANGNAVVGTQATVTGSFDPDGAGPLPVVSAATTVSSI